MPAERRNPDQDTAVEEAFANGTLPDEDRRTDAEKAAIAALEQAEADALAAAAPVPIVESQPVPEVDGGRGVGIVFPIP